jgi:hypothetical protein
MVNQPEDFNEYFRMHFAHRMAVGTKAQEKGLGNLARPGKTRYNDRLSAFWAREFINRLSYPKRGGQLQ